MILTIASRCLLHRISPFKGRLHLKCSAESPTFARRINLYFGTKKKEFQQMKDDRAESLGLSEEKIYLHISPDGDFWTSGEIFAAKHLQPDYVRSFRLTHMETDELERVMDVVQGNDLNLDIMMKHVYDTGNLSPLFNVLENYTHDPNLTKDNQ